jgi:cytoskeletal protein RodZ
MVTDASKEVSPMQWSGWMALPMILAILGWIAMWAAIVALVVDALNRRHRRHHHGGHDLP